MSVNVLKYPNEPQKAICLGNTGDLSDVLAQYEREGREEVQVLLPDAGNLLEAMRICSECELNVTLFAADTPYISDKETAAALAKEISGLEKLFFSPMSSANAQMPVVAAPKSASGKKTGSSFKGLFKTSRSNEETSDTAIPEDMFMGKSARAAVPEDTCRYALPTPKDYRDSVCGGTGA